MALVRGGKVLGHVQAFADAVSRATGAESFGTYPGHSPSIDRALDIFVPVNSSTLGNALCGFAIANQERFGVRYVIYRQRIWHRLDPVWRLMEDRTPPGRSYDYTQNHYDHGHFAFETEAAEPTPATPQPEPENDMAGLFIFDYVPANGDGKPVAIIYTDGRLKWGVASGEQLAFYGTGKVPHLGAKGDQFFHELDWHPGGIDSNPGVGLVEVEAGHYSLAGGIDEALAASAIETCGEGCAG